MSGLPTQQQAQARTASSTSAPLSNGKLGGGANWSFNLPVSGTSSLPGNQQRTMGTMGSFAQSLGGSQSTAPLDLSEFPSLSGASQQSQSQTPGQLMWANASQRAAQQTPVQRQQLPPTSQTPSRSSQPQGLPTPQQSQPPHDDMFPSGAQFANRLDDFRNGGQGISSQLGAGGQPQTGNIEEFPLWVATLLLSFLSVELDLNNGVLPGQRNFSDPQLQQRQRENSDGQDVSSAPQSTEQPPLAQMSELDRFGLAGLLRMIHSESPDVASLAVGQDLMTLGLDLNQAEPLHTSFASPFVSSMSAVPLEQDFSLPGCYNVANIQPLQSRIPGFSDETLFFIFYSMPRDIMQELVAEELMGRKWRYHKLERCWLTRDETYPGPVDVERGVTERGVYLLWDSSAWKKVRREFILRYEDLDNRLDPNRGAARPPGVVHHAS
ncbi:hypothetical protein N7491_010749 [Penicillium cf. griseofulvum]|nr:hypothetical protein N7491_010749 [Penicillium cf. griseofulvum]